MKYLVAALWLGAFCLAAEPFFLMAVNLPTVGELSSGVGHY